MSREYEVKALEYIKTCPNPNDRAYILALSVALDTAHGRITTLVDAAMKLTKDIEQTIKNAGC